jgi:PBSX family phage terminase large subunit
LTKATGIRLSELLKPTAKQRQCLKALRDNSTTEILYGGGAGGGKSYLGCAWILINALKYSGTRWLIGRSKLKSLEETTLNSFWQVCEAFGLKADIDYKYNSQKSFIKFSNGSVVLLKDLFLYPSDPNFDSLGSLEITGAFIDECNQIVEKAWNIVKSRIRYKLDVYGLIPKILGSCNPAKNWVYTKFYKPFKDHTLPKIRAFIQALVDDNPYISKHYRENLLSLDKASKERLLYGNWEYDDDPTVLIDYEAIINSFSNTHINGNGKRYISADIARFGKDKSVYIVWDGWKALKMIVKATASITENAEFIKELKQTYGVPTLNIICDEGGLGGGVVDILACRGFVSNSRPMVNKDAVVDSSDKQTPGKGAPENYDNLKSQCYFKLAQDINNNLVNISALSDYSAEIIEELEQVKQKNMDSDMKRGVISKDKVKELIGRSPDFSDTIMMRKWFDLFREPGKAKTSLPYTGSQRIKTDFDWVK